MFESSIFICLHTSLTSPIRDFVFVQENAFAEASVLPLLFPPLCNKMADSFFLFEDGCKHDWRQIFSHTKRLDG